MADPFTDQEQKAMDFLTKYHDLNEDAQDEGRLALIEILTGPGAVRAEIRSAMADALEAGTLILWQVDD